MYLEVEVGAKSTRHDIPDWVKEHFPMVDWWSSCKTHYLATMYLTVYFQIIWGIQL